MTDLRPTLALAATLALGLLLQAPSPAHAQAAPDDPAVLHVVKSPTCGCCGAWADLARAHGFAVEVTDSDATIDAKREAGVPEALWACHTARIGGYVVEGHVPFEAIDRLLSERPAIAGLSVPGMPAGSPGMGSDPDAAYDVMAFGGEAGDGAVFERVGR